MGGCLVHARTCCTCACVAGVRADVHACGHVCLLRACGRAPRQAGMSALCVRGHLVLRSLSDVLKHHPRDTFSARWSRERPVVHPVPGADVGNSPGDTHDRSWCRYVRFHLQHVPSSVQMCGRLPVQMWASKSGQRCSGARVGNRCSVGEPGACEKVGTNVGESWC